MNPTEPELIRVESGGRLIGLVAIDSTISGRSRGGLRLVPELDDDELRLAARAMTLKYGLLELPQGGAKAAVQGDPDRPVAERRARLLELGHAIEPLLRARRYVPDADLGTSAADMRWLFSRLELPVVPREWRVGDSGAWTAESVVSAARAAVEHSGRSLGGATVAVEGFGAVGSAVAELAAAAGARVVAISTSRGALVRMEGLEVAACVAAARREGSAFVQRYPAAQQVTREELLALRVDVLFPCARARSVTRSNVDSVRAKLVCPGANAPLTLEAEGALAARGVLVMPDFFANCGGVLGGTMAFAAIEPGRIGHLIAHQVGATARTLLERAEQAGVPPRMIAEQIAFARLARVRSAVEQPTLVGRLFAFALDGYRRGLIPGRLVGALAPGWFARRLRL